MVILAVVLAAVATAQERPALQNTEYSVWAAEAFGNGHAFASAQDRRFSMLSFRWARTVGNLGPVNFRYVVEARPVAVLGDLKFNGAQRKREYVYSGGFSPIGVEMTLAPRRRVHPFLACNGGFLYFTQRALSAAGSNLQFTIYLAPGVEFALPHNESVRVGYMYHHFSNANIAENYSLDAHMIFAGFSSYRGSSVGRLGWIRRALR
ncbi:MAG: acyloxyacyl hydrolase [Terriglobales bacterium]